MSGSDLPAGVVLHRFEVSNYRPAVNTAIWSQNGRQLHLHVFHFPRFGDIDGNGRLELVYSKGCNEQVAYDLDGRQRWRFFQPGLTTFDPIREDSLAPILDVDHDGRVELGCYRLIDGQPHLCLVDAVTGDLLRSIPIERNPITPDTRCALIPAALDGDGKPLSLVLTRDYWRIEVYSHDLKPRWSATIEEFGHTAQAVDVDGDGREELFTGTRLFDPTGRCLWSRPELLDGTGETHPDSFRAADVDGDGRPELALATGAQLLNVDGTVRWRRSDHVHHGQAVRVLRHASGARLCFVDQPKHDSPSRLHWRGRSVPDIECVSTVMDGEGKIISEFPGVHVPETGDWDGDGEDEVLLLARDHFHIEVRKQDGSLLARLPVGERVYVSDMIVAPVLSNARGAQLILTEWDAAEEHTHCLIFENTSAGDRCPPTSALERARLTPY